MTLFLCWCLALVVHETGHSVVAWLCGVRVLRVSLFVDGWGWAPLRVMVRGTEFQIGWLPISGYTKLAGYDRLDPERDPTTQFCNMGLMSRLAILLAGPSASIAMALACMVMMRILPSGSGLLVPTAIGVLMNTYLAAMSLLPLPGTDAARALREWSNTWFLGRSERVVQSLAWAAMVVAMVVYAWDAMLAAWAVAC